MEKEIFKVEDKVFHYGFGWGKIDFIDDEPNDYPIIVVFNPEKGETFTLDGKFDLTDINPTLSLTEYTLEGFSQEKPIILPEVGELCLVRDTDSENWMAVVFSKYNPNKDYPFQSKGGSIWKQMKRIKILD